jgi:hypothetical protein
VDLLCLAGCSVICWPLMESSFLSMLTHAIIISNNLLGRSFGFFQVNCE